MNYRKLRYVGLLLLVCLAISLLIGGSGLVGAAGPANPTDESKVPHYFGPNPNWANSPFTLPDAVVTITGDGTGATAEASVGANGAVTGITITNPGSGYTAATVDIAGGDGLASAVAVVSTTGSVTAVTVDTPGTGYTLPTVDISVPTVGTGATATAYGGVDAVTVVYPPLNPDEPFKGYMRPTVDFDLPDGPNGVSARGVVICEGDDPLNGPYCQGTPPLAPVGVKVTQPGSGYSSAPHVVIRDGTIYDPVPSGGFGATATSTLAVQEVVLDTFGDGYTISDILTVTISDSGGVGSGATATATTSAGAVTAINLTAGGSGYVTAGGIKKFQDGLPMLCDPSVAGSCAAAANNLGQYLPLAVPDTTTFSTANGFDLDADYYVIALVQHREQMHSDLPPTLVREYVQLETPANVSWSKSIPLENDLLNGNSVPALMPDGVTQAVAVDNPHFLGPVISATKDKPVRITFYNLLPNGAEGDLFLPTDSTIMGSGPGPNAPMSVMQPTDEGTVMDLVRNQVCTEYDAATGKPADCFKDNRATLHLHGGITPWISDGTPHQWITPANETTPYPQGVSVDAVPDMESCTPDDPDTPDVDESAIDGCMTFYYTNQQSARFMFYHDHAWGITRLNVYAGEAAGYVITDDTDAKLMAPGGPLADVGLGIPLVIQDRTFVPQDEQLYNQYDVNGNVTSYGQDPTWDASRWGGYGNFWYHHVYMPAQNPGDPSGMSAFGRWMYGPWFWPPATPPHGPIANPYYDISCDLNDPLTWQYDTDPFCEPEMIPGTPNISAGMEQFNDTPIVNGTAYPTVTLDPKSYRFRILNAANDRFWNLQWYVADPSSVADPAIGPTEVALNPAELAAAQLDPNIFPTPVDATTPDNPSFAAPDWFVIGSEGGFLPAPVVVDGQQPTTWIIDPTVFNVGNVDKHALLVAPAERHDVIVDFSKYAGQTLILYNDAPAAFPARVASYDYYTGAPDLSPVGAPAILPGYGPNTRTIMQVKIAAGTPAAQFDLPKLKAAFSHNADGTGVFESGQHPIIVGQAEYNSAYGTEFAASGNCTSPDATIKCDGHARINQQGGDLFTFDTLRMNHDGSYPTGYDKVSIPLEPKAIHDEMNATAFDEFGRMQANLGLEAVPATPGLQNVILYPFTNPATEIINATNLPTTDMEVTPISTSDGTQIWKITHNGVDTHPIHWHLYDVQVLNRTTWDNIVSSPDPTELGWKDTLRVSPLEDTYVALRPIIPTFPFEIPNSVRPLNPMMPLGSVVGFNNTDAQGNPTAPIVNQMVNFGWEYVYHCHILSHEEMDMMRPVSVALPPNAVDDLTATISTTGKPEVTLAWTDNSRNETQFVVQRQTNGSDVWDTLATLLSPLSQKGNGTGPMTYVDTTYKQNSSYMYRVVAENAVGYGGAYMQTTVRSYSNIVGPPVGTTTLDSVSQVTGTRDVRLNWTFAGTGQTGFTIQQSINADFSNPVTTIKVGNVATYTIPRVQRNRLFYYRVSANNFLGNGSWSNSLPLTVQ